MVRLMEAPKFLWREWDIVNVYASTKKEAISKVCKRFPKYPVQSASFTGEAWSKVGRLVGLWEVTVMKERGKKK